MIVRQWHGWTIKDQADAYQELFHKSGQNVYGDDGSIGAYLLRRDVGDEVEFDVQRIFQSMEAVGAKFGDDYEVAGLIPGAEKLLSRYDERCSHFEIVDDPSRSL